MNFLEMVKELKKGNKARRPNWSKGQCLETDELGSIRFKDNLISRTTFPRINQIEADDWEVVEEKKTLSDKIEREVFREKGMEYCVLKVENVKEAVRKEEEMIRRRIRNTIFNKDLKNREEAMIAFENGFWNERIDIFGDRLV